MCCDCLSYHLDHLSLVHRPLAFPTCDVKSVGPLAVGSVELDLYRSDRYAFGISLFECCDNLTLSITEPVRWSE